MAGAWPDPVKRNTKRVLAGAGNGRSQLAGATMINFTQTCLVNKRRAAPHRPRLSRVRGGVGEIK